MATSLSCLSVQEDTQYLVAKQDPEPADLLAFEGDLQGQAFAWQPTYGSGFTTDRAMLCWPK